MREREGEEEREGGRENLSGITSLVVGIKGVGMPLALPN